MTATTQRVLSKWETSKREMINIVPLTRKLLRVIECNRVPTDTNLYF